MLERRRLMLGEEAVLGVSDGFRPARLTAGED